MASIHAVTPSLLAELGITALLVDLDDTILAASEDELDDSVPAWFARLRSEGVQVAILSNGTRERVARVAEAVNVPAIAMAGKPLPRAFRKGLALLPDVPRNQVGMVGDQVFTDVLGARRAGLVAILVEPLSPGKLLHTRLARRLEKLVLGTR